METRRLLHASLLITDLDRSRQFYEGVLGLRPKPRHKFDFAGMWYDLGECELHLVVTDGTLPAAQERPDRDFHVAFAIEDYEVTKNALIRSGVPFREGRSGLAQIFVRDPDGNQIELQKRAG